MIITKQQAYELKLFLWGQCSKDLIGKISMETINEINRMLDKASQIESQKTWYAENFSNG